jgi:hypothetical protein
VTITSSDTLRLQFGRRGSNHNYDVTVPDCVKLGFDNTFFGVSMTDATEMWMLSAVVLATIYYIKILKRGT